MNKFVSRLVRSTIAMGLAGSLMFSSSLSIFAEDVEPVSVEVVKSLIRNSDFELGKTNWGTYVAGGAKSALITEDGKLALDITSVGTLNYGVQMFHDITPMYQNGVYRLRFDISSTVDRTVEAIVQENGNDYTAYFWKALELTPEAQSLEFTFTMEEATDLLTKLVFNCGNQGADLEAHKIYLDNVYLDLIDDSNVDYSSFQTPEETILTNQVGYLKDNKKVAVFRGKNLDTEFNVVDVKTNQTVYTGNIYGEFSNADAKETNWYGDFSELKTEGTYKITTETMGESFPFTIGDNSIYSDLFRDSIYMLYLQRCGCEVIDDDFGHDACHTSLATVLGTDEKIDVTGGWHDAGDYGRYIVPAAKTVADLLLAYDVNPELYTDNIGIPESGNGVPDVLDEARYEIEWMLKMQNKENGGVYHKVSCADFPGYIMPEAEKGALYVTPISTTATADFAASMAMAYEWYLDIDKEFAETCLAAAEKASGFLKENTSLIYTNPTEINTGAYGDKSDKDERYWAYAQLYRATGKEEYKTAFENLLATGVKSGYDWSTVGGYGNTAYLTMDSSLVDTTAYEKIKTAVLKEAGSLVATSKADGYGVTLGSYYWGSNMGVANNGMLLYLANTLSPNAEFISVANEQLNYLLGKNACGTSFVTGYGTVSPLLPHHRPSMAVGKAMPGMLVGGVNSALEDDTADALLYDKPIAKRFIDNAESYSTNEITIYWNSPFTYLMSYVMTPQKAVVVEDVLGDVSGDGKVDNVDLVSFCRFLVKDVDFDANTLKKADISGDGVVDIADVALLKQYIMGDNVTGLN